MITFWRSWGLLSCQRVNRRVAPGSATYLIGLGEIELDLVRALAVQALHAVHRALAECLAHGIEEDEDQIRLFGQEVDHLR